MEIGNTAYGPKIIEKDDTGANASSNSAARPHFENGQQRKVKCWECPVCECMNSYVILRYVYVLFCVCVSFAHLSVVICHLFCLLFFYDKCG